MMMVVVQQSAEHLSSALNKVDRLEDIDVSVHSEDSSGEALAAEGTRCACLTRCWSRSENPIRVKYLQHIKRLYRCKSLYLETEP